MGLGSFRSRRHFLGGAGVVAGIVLSARRLLGRGDAASSSAGAAARKLTGFGSTGNVYEELGLTTVPGASAVGTEGGLLATPGVAADPVLGCLVPGEASDLDEIAERSGLKTPRLLPRLFELELQGLVRRAGGGRFVRIDRTC